jgi:hypothetical protein
MTNSDGKVNQLRAALELIEATPYSMVNDSESLRHTIKSIQHIARTALRKTTPANEPG